MSFLDTILESAKSVVDYKEPRSFYVYFGLIDGEVAYVGKGIRDRYKHLTNVCISEVEGVARAKSEGKQFDIYILCDWLSSDEALALEKSAIRGLQPTLNKEMYLPNVDTKRGWKVPSTPETYVSPDTAPALHYTLNDIPPPYLATALLSGQSLCDESRICH